MSSSARPVVYQRSNAADAGEADTFPATYAFLCKHFGRSFDIVTYDAGDTSRSNATRVNDSPAWLLVRREGADVVREAFGVFVDIRQTSTWRDEAGVVNRRVVEGRYVITNRVFSAENALRLTRLHWGIENGPNWTMDLVLGEDDGAVCTKGVAVEVWRWLCLLAYNLIAFWRRKLPRADGQTPSWERARNLLRDAFLALQTSFATAV